MSAEAEPVAARLAPRFEATTGVWAALITTLVGALCLALGPHLTWLVGWPAALTLPMTDWVGAGLTWFLEGIKPVARGFSVAMQYVMEASNWVFSIIPWPLFIGLVTAMGWVVGGAGMAGLCLTGLLFVLFSGYLEQGMNTLALVAVSVPLALFIGVLIGVAANEIPKLKPPGPAGLDGVETVPNFSYL
ncbi:MAG: glycine/betaine ABC transporter permease, partial [Arenibacterium sp.]